MAVIPYRLPCAKGAPTQVGGGLPKNSCLKFVRKIKTSVSGKNPKRLQREILRKKSVYTANLKAVMLASFIVMPSVDVL